MDDQLLSANMLICIFGFQILEYRNLFKKNCIFGSGDKTAVVTINGQFPPKPIEVMEGALVHVKVSNNLFGGVSPVIHFHGFKFGSGYFW